MIKQILNNQENFLLHDFLSADECDRLIAKSEAIGYEDAPITTAAGPVMKKNVRDNTRVMHDDPELASELFELARPFLPEKIPGGWRISGLNERLRYYRYDVGEKFAPHFDGAFARDDNDMSHLTFMIYLNDGFEGGETKFYGPSPFIVTPQRGSALVFVHRQLHEGAALIAGRKYVLRSDVMYKRSWNRL